MRVLVQIGLVAFGSGLGGVLRWGVNVATIRMFGTAYPVGTFLTNMAGCLFLGWLATLLGDRQLLGVGWLDADDLRLVVVVGFIGAFATFPMFEYESDRMLDKNGFWGVTYLFASVFFGLTAMRVGVLLARWR